MWCICFREAFLHGLLAGKDLQASLSGLAWGQDFIAAGRWIWSSTWSRWTWSPVRWTPPSPRCLKGGVHGRQRPSAGPCESTSAPFLWRGRSCTGHWLGCLKGPSCPRARLRGLSGGEQPPEGSWEQGGREKRSVVFGQVVVLGDQGLALPAQGAGSSAPLARQAVISPTASRRNGPGAATASRYGAPWWRCHHACTASCASSCAPASALPRAHCRRSATACRGPFERAPVAAL